MATIDLPAKDSDINIFVIAMNVFGAAEASNVSVDDISELQYVLHVHICILILYSGILMQTKHLRN